MTSPLTAVVSHAASQTAPSPPSGTPKGDAASQGHASAQEMSRVASAAAERINKQTREENRVIKRDESRAEAGFAPQKRKPQKAGKEEEPAEPEAKSEHLGHKIDVAV